MLRNRLLLPLVLTTLLSMACSETSLRKLCGESSDAFDIEEASVLQDAQSYPNMHDAVILDYDIEQLATGEVWRVGKVDILAMIPASQFASYPDGATVTVEVFDAEHPGTPDSWSVTQNLVKADLTWEDVELTNPTEAFETSQKRAWWSFDFRDVIPTEGMTGPSYLVGVWWDISAAPPLGYSNFNRRCDRNWTDYADGSGWVLNSDTAGQDIDSCSWPMLKVQVEVLSEREDCGPGSEVVD